MESMPGQAKAIISQLAMDGRTSYAELAERADTSPTTARRWVSDLLGSGILILRTDVSAQDAGWPVEAYVWANAPISTLRDTARQLSQMRQTRLTATVAAGPVIALSTWLRTVEELHRLELTITEQLPQLQVVDRLIVLRVVKRVGRLIDEGPVNGRRPHQHLGRSGVRPGPTPGLPTWVGIQPAGRLNGGESGPVVPWQREPLSAAIGPHELPGTARQLVGTRLAHCAAEKHAGR